MNLPINTTVTWTNRGNTYTGIIRAVNPAGERLEDALDRMESTHPDADLKRMRINHENRTSGQDRYIVECKRIITKGPKTGYLDSPDWRTPPCSLIDSQEGPVRKALRVAGVSRVLEYRTDGSMEVGYPASADSLDMVSTGIVMPDGSFAPPSGKAFKRERAGL